MRIAIAATVAAALVSTAAAAQTGDATAAKAPPPAPEKKICRKVGVTVGRLPPQKVCHTAADWADIDARPQTTGGGVAGSSRLPGGR